MRKDFKTGMCAGLIVSAGALLWFGTRSRLPVETVEVLPEVVETTQPLPTEPINAPAEKEPQIQKPAEKPFRFHIVQQGETLSDISNRYYGNRGQWQKILDANKRTVPSAEKLRPGVKLVIPD